MEKTIIQGCTNGNRSRGRQRQRWVEDISDRTGHGKNHAIRTQWHNVLLTVTATTTLDILAFSLTHRSTCNIIKHQNHSQSTNLRQGRSDITYNPKEVIVGRRMCRLNSLSLTHPSGVWQWFGVVNTLKNSRTAYRTGLPLKYLNVFSVACVPNLPANFVKIGCIVLRKSVNKQNEHSDSLAELTRMELVRVHFLNNDRAIPTRDPTTASRMWWGSSPVEMFSFPWLHNSTNILCSLCLRHTVWECILGE